MNADPITVAYPEGPLFEFGDGTRCDLCTLIVDNAEDTKFILWASAADVGDSFPWVVGCRRVA